MIMKSVLTIFTFGSKVPCGLFIPTLCVGSIFGRIFGMIIEQLTYEYKSFWLWSSVCQTASVCAVPGVYAMVGAAAFLGGVTRMTVSLVVIMFELTGSLQHIVPFMIAAMTSKWVGDAFKNGGIYDDHIDLNGYPFLDNKEEFHDTHYAIDVMRPRKTADNITQPLVTINQDGCSVGQLEKLCKTTQFHGFPVVVSNNLSTNTNFSHSIQNSPDRSNRLVGFVLRRELMITLYQARLRDIEVLGSTLVTFSIKSANLLENSARHKKILRLNDIIDLHPITVTIHTPMEIVVEIFKKLGVRQVLRGEVISW